MKTNRQGTAFTLVELLVVIAVLAVLASLLLPMASGVKMQGLISKSTSNLRQLAAANSSYAADNGTFVPAYNLYTNNERWCGARNSASDAWDPAKGYLAPYLGESRRITPCPLLSEVLKGEDSFEEGAGGYGYNAVYIGAREPSEQWQPPPMDSKGVLIAERPVNVAFPSQTVMFTTAALIKSGGLQEYPFAEPPFWDFGGGASSYRPTPSVHFRANGKALVAWCDGHVSAEAMDNRPVGTNPYGGDAMAAQLGWFGPDEENGFWNAKRSRAIPD